MAPFDEYIYMHVWICNNIFTFDNTQVVIIGSVHCTYISLPPPFSKLTFMVVAKQVFNGVTPHLINQIGHNHHLLIVMYFITRIV